MQAAYAVSFERVMTCTLADWLRLLPSAIGEHPYTKHDDTALIQLSHAKNPAIRPTLALQWHTGPTRQIALIRLPQLHVRFQFNHADAALRLAFMQRFDLFMQRGGG